MVTVACSWRRSIAISFTMPLRPTTTAAFAQFDSFGRRSSITPAGVQGLGRVGSGRAFRRSPDKPSTSFGRIRSRNSSSQVVRKRELQEDAVTSFRSSAHRASTSSSQLVLPGRRTPSEKDLLRRSAVLLGHRAGMRDHRRRDAAMPRHHSASDQGFVAPDLVPDFVAYSFSVENLRSQSSSISAQPLAPG
jgi:hypothetical protein